MRNRCAYRTLTNLQNFLIFTYVNLNICETILIKLKWEGIATSEKFLFRKEQPQLNSDISFTKIVTDVRPAAGENFKLN